MTRIDVEPWFDADVTWDDPPTGPFVPAQFTSPIIAVNAVNLTRRVPYVSISEFSAAPTALTLSSIVPGGTMEQNVAEAYNILLRASDIVDLICFHDPGGTLAASPTQESGWVTPKSGDLWIQANYKPILAVTGLALGTGPQALQDIGTTAAQNINIEGTLIQLLGASWYACAPFSSTSLSAPPTRRGRVYAAWSYINGFPHMTLAAPAAADATTITVAPSVPGGTSPYGVWPGTQLTIRDAATTTGGTEAVVVSAVSGNTIQLTAPLLYTHTPPSAPDSIIVSAVPDAVEQACISLASYLIKLRGSRAAVMASIASGKTNGPKVASQAGGSDDYDTAVTLLKPFTTVYRRNTSGV